MNIFKNILFSLAFLSVFTLNPLKSMYGRGGLPPRPGFHSPQVSPARAAAGRGIRRSVSSGVLSSCFSEEFFTALKFNLKHAFPGSKIKGNKTLQFLSDSIATVSRFVLNKSCSTELKYLQLLHEWMIEFDFMVKRDGARYLILALTQALTSPEAKPSPLELGVSSFSPFDPERFIVLHITTPLKNFTSGEFDLDKLGECVAKFSRAFADLRHCPDLSQSFIVLDVFFKTVDECKKKPSAFDGSPARSDRADGGSVGLELEGLSLSTPGRTPGCALDLRPDAPVSFDRSPGASSSCSEGFSGCGAGFSLGDRLSFGDSLLEAGVKPSPGADSHLLPAGKSVRKSRKRGQGKAAGSRPGLGAEVWQPFARHGSQDQPPSKKLNSGPSLNLGEAYLETVRRDAASATAAEAVPEFDLGDPAFDVEAFFAAHQEYETFGRVTPDTFE